MGNYKAFERQVPGKLLDKDSDRPGMASHEYFAGYVLSIDFMRKNEHSSEGRTNNIAYH
jgi:hypothetical protein